MSEDFITATFLLFFSSPYPCSIYTGDFYEWLLSNTVPSTEKSIDKLKLTIWSFHLQAERLRKEEADAHRKAEDEAKKKIALSNMGSGYSSILQRVVLSRFLLLLVALMCWISQSCNFIVFKYSRLNRREARGWLKERKRRRSWRTESNLWTLTTSVRINWGKVRRNYWIGTASSTQGGSNELHALKVLPKVKIHSSTYSWISGWVHKMLLLFSDVKSLVLMVWAPHLTHRTNIRSRWSHANINTNWGYNSRLFLTFSFSLNIWPSIPNTHHKVLLCHILII